ncbi:hypothetical protein HK096_003825, partial [Nowakowskiella sp. JEL0078]
MYLKSKTSASPLQIYNQVPCIDSILPNYHQFDRQSSSLPAKVSRLMETTSKVSLFVENSAKRNIDELNDCIQTRKHIREYLISKPDAKSTLDERHEELVSDAFQLTEFLENNAKADTVTQTENAEMDLDVESIQQIVCETLASFTEANEKVESSQLKSNNKSQSCSNSLTEEKSTPFSSSWETTAPSWHNPNVLKTESSVLLNSWSTQQTLSNQSQMKSESIPSWNVQTPWNTSSIISNTSFSSILQTPSASGSNDPPPIPKHTPLKSNSITIDLTAASTQHLLQLQTPNLTFEKSGWEDDSDNDDKMSVCSFASTGTVQWAPIASGWKSQPAPVSNGWGECSQKVTPISNGWGTSDVSKSMSSGGYDSQTTLTGWDSKSSETSNDDKDEMDQNCYEKPDDDVSKFWSCSWGGAASTSNNCDNFVDDGIDIADCEDAIDIKCQLAKADLEIARLNTLVMALSSKVNESDTASLFSESRCDCKSLASNEGTDHEVNSKSQESQTTMVAETEFSTVVNLFSHYVLRTEKEKRAMQNGISCLLTQIKECDEKFEASAKICSDMKSSVKDTIEKLRYFKSENQNMKLEKSALLETIGELTQKNTLLSSLLDEKENTISALKKVFENENFKPVDPLKLPRQLKRSFTWVGNNGIWTKVEVVDKQVETTKLPIEITTNTHNESVDTVNYNSVSNNIEETLIQKTELESLSNETSQNTEIAERKTSNANESMCNYAQRDFHNTMMLNPNEQSQYQPDSETPILEMSLEKQDTHSIPESPGFISSTSETGTIVGDLLDFQPLEEQESSSPEQLPIDLSLNFRRGSNGRIYSIFQTSWTMSPRASSAELKEVVTESLEGEEFTKLRGVEDTDLISQASCTNTDSSSTTMSESCRTRFKHGNKVGGNRESAGKRILK